MVIHVQKETVNSKDFRRSVPGIQILLPKVQDPQLSDSQGNLPLNCALETRQLCKPFRVAGAMPHFDAAY